MSDINQGVFGLAFALAITGLLPGWISAAILGGTMLLFAAWLALVFCPPLVRGMLDLLTGR